MKYYLLFIVLNLVIIFAYADLDNKGKVRFEKMQNHFRKIKGILRNLDTSDEDDDDDDSTDEEGSNENEDNPTNSTSTQPDAGTTQPDAGTTQPDAGTTQPDAGTTQPDAGTTQPDAGTTQPDAGTTQPDAGTTQPDAGTTQPDAGTTQPDAGTTQPAGNNTQPDIETETPTTTPALPTTPKTTGKKSAKVQLIDINTFNAPREQPIITFRAFFTYINIRPARWVVFNIYIRISRVLRYLDGDYEERPVNCTIDKEDELKTSGDNIRYNCETDKEENTEVANISVINATFSEPELKDEDINYSEEAAIAAVTLVNKTEVVNKIYRLDSCQINPYSNYFTISGTMNNLDDEAFRKNFGITDKIILKIYDNSTTPSTPYNATCTLQDKGNKNYEYRCIPDEGAKGVVDLSPIKKANGYGLSFQITKGTDYLNYAKDNSTNVNYNKGVATYRKSSSGLSGGAIAGIVIACVVALIIASLVAIMMRKSAAAAAPFQSQTPSIVGLRSVDNNYSQ